MNKIKTTGFSLVAGMFLMAALLTTINTEHVGTAFAQNQSTISGENHLLIFLHDGESFFSVLKATKITRNISLIGVLKTGNFSCDIFFF